MFEKISQNIKGDKYIWAIILLLSMFSLLAVYSSIGTLAYKYRSGNTQYYLIKQLLVIGGGLGLVYLTHLVNYRYFSRISQILYYLSIVLLIITLFFGTDVNEAKRWITLPVVNLTFQTSDLAKFALIMYLARMLSKKQDLVTSFSEGFWPYYFARFYYLRIDSSRELIIGIGTFFNQCFNPVCR
jgi:cell division protein FtsW